MPDPESISSESQRQLQRILKKITEYQHSLPDGRAVELDELQREGVLSSADIDFMAAHSVTYKPHRASDYHATDMLHMPLSDGGCVFTGPSARTPIKRRIQLKEFQTVIQSFLRIPRPDDELLLHIEFAENDGVAVSPEGIFLIFASDRWRERLPEIRSVGAEFGFDPIQDQVVQNHHVLGFRIPRDADRTSAAVVALLRRGCGLTDESEVCYAGGALDEL
jgi:hypothetical protein